MAGGIPRDGGQGMEITFDGVGKCYGGRWAVRGITLSLRSGIVGLPTLEDAYLYSVTTVAGGEAACG